MKKIIQFLEKIRLIEYYSIEIAIKRQEFIDSFRKLIAIKTKNWYYTTHGPYTGYVNEDQFKIRLKTNTWNNRYKDYYTPQAIGNLVQQENKLVIDVKIQGFSAAIAIQYLITAVFSIVIFWMFFDTILRGQLITSILIFGMLLFIWIEPYVSIRRSMKKTLRELDKNLYTIETNDTISVP